MAKKLPKIVVIGGGTGTHTVLSGLKHYPVDLTAIISMTDSGGTARVMRDELGLLPNSDVRKCITALADEKKYPRLRELFMYRYDHGTGLAGMTLGSLLMAAMTDIVGNEEEAIDEVCKMMGVKGQILPVTYDNAHLLARYDHGKQILGEHYIDEPNSETGKHKIVELSTVPQALANPKALNAIVTADLIIFGPGDLFTSTICNLVVEGIPQAIQKSKAKKIFVINLMTKFGQTNNMTSSDHLATLEKYLYPNAINYCLVNSASEFPQTILERYLEEQASQVTNTLESKATLTVIQTDLVSQDIFTPSKSDTLKRSLIRHDPAKLAKAIYSLI